MKNELIELTDLERVALVLIKEGFVNIPKDILTDEIVDKLLLYKLIETSGQGYWIITEKGIEITKLKSIIRYALHNRGKVSDYNSTFQTMTPNAKNAALCAMMNSDFISQCPVDTRRVFAQHLLDIKEFKKWGEVLVNKWYEELKKSRKYFDNKRKKNGK